MVSRNRGEDPSALKPVGDVKVAVIAGGGVHPSANG